MRTGILEEQARAHLPLWLPGDPGAWIYSFSYTVSASLCCLAKNCSPGGKSLYGIGSESGLLPGNHPYGFAQTYNWRHSPTNETGHKCSFLLGDSHRTCTTEGEVRETILGVEYEKRNMQIHSCSHVNLGIVCPMANEIDNAESFVTEVLNICKKFDFKSIRMYAVFDKKCTDGTYKLLKSLATNVPELVVVFAPENRNVVDAYLRGYSEALSNNSDWILEIDAGYSHQPTDIPRFFEKMKDGYDCVFGSRFCHGAKLTDKVLKRYLISRGGTLLTNFLLGTKLTDMTSGFELFSRDALNKILDKGIRSQGPFFQTEIRTHGHAFSIAEVPIHYKAPSHNVGSKAVSDAFSNLWDILKEVRFKSGTTIE